MRQTVTVDTEATCKELRKALEPFGHTVEESGDVFIVSVYKAKDPEEEVCEILSDNGIEAYVEEG